MENTVRAMMGLIANEVCGSAIDKKEYSFSQEELVKLYKLSKTHDLAHLVGDALIKNDLLSDAEIRAKFEKQIMVAVLRYEKINYELERLRETLNEAKIPFIPLKGSVIRQYYPEPWMRTSCDIDILVHEKDISAALNMLMKQLNGGDIIRSHHDISFMTSGGVHIELHHSLIEKNRIGTAEKILDDIWNWTKQVGETAEYILRDEMFYYYHMAHMAKHIEGGGCGVRPFLDLWLLNQMNHDELKRVELLKFGGLDTFARVANQLSQYWFCGGKSDKLMLDLEKYIICAGVYGSSENSVAVRQTHKKSKFKYILRRIWMPYQDLKLQYPGVEKYRFLQPIYEFRRWCKLLKPSMFKRKSKELKIITGTSAEKVNDTNQLFVSLGLIDHK
mgnify:CR=1 FL=1